MQPASSSCRSTRARTAPIASGSATQAMVRTAMPARCGAAPRSAKTVALTSPARVTGRSSRLEVSLGQDSSVTSGLYFLQFLICATARSASGVAVPNPKNSR